MMDKAKRNAKAGRVAGPFCVGRYLRVIRRLMLASFPTAFQTVMINYKVVEE